MIRVHVRVSEIIGALIDADAEKKTCVLSLISILSMSTFTYEKKKRANQPHYGTYFHPTYIFQIQTKWYVCMYARGFNLR